MQVFNLVKLSDHPPQPSFMCPLTSVGQSLTCFPP